MWINKNHRKLSRNVQLILGCNLENRKPIALTFFRRNSIDLLSVERNRLGRNKILRTQLSQDLEKLIKIWWRHHIHHSSHMNAEANDRFVRDYLDYVWGVSISAIILFLCPLWYKINLTLMLIFNLEFCICTS